MVTCGSSDNVHLSIVIVSWNTRELLGHCLESLVSLPIDMQDLAQVGTGARLSTEVLVIDNASADGSADLVRARFPWVRLIENAANLGFAAACNVGIRAAGGRYVLLLNPDAEVEPTALAALVSFMDTN